MSEILGSILIGLFIGIATNLTAWWILFHYIVPEIRFSPLLSKIPTNENNSGYKYRFKLQNVGKRSIIDVEIFARVNIKGLGDFPRNIRIVDIPISNKLRTHRIPIIPPISENFTGKILQIFPNEVDEFKELSRYPEHIRIKANEEKLLLEDVMSMGTETTLQIMAFGYDEFSGTKRFFISKEYTDRDVIEGKYYHGLEVKKLNFQNKFHPWERFSNFLQKK